MGYAVGLATWDVSPSRTVCCFGEVLSAMVWIIPYLERQLSSLLTERFHAVFCVYQCLYIMISIINQYQEFPSLLKIPTLNKKTKPRFI